MHLVRTLILCTLATLTVVVDAGLSRVAVGQTRLKQIPDIAERPALRVTTQPNAPVAIAMASPTEASIDQAGLTVIVENASSKAVRSVAIRYDVKSESARYSGLELATYFSRRTALLPGQRKTIDVNQDNHYTDRLKEIVVSIDLVEFWDGTTWGADTYQSADRVAGQRAGIAAAVDYLIHLGSSAVVLDAARGELASVQAPADKSEQWARAFRSGVTVVKAKLLAAYERGGEPGMAEELEHARTDTGAEGNQ